MQSQLFNMIVYGTETFYTDRAVRYANCINKLSKISGKCKRDLPQREEEKCKKDCIVFKGADSFNETLDHVLQFKGEAEKNKIESVKYNLSILAKNGSGFESYVVLNNRPQWKTVVSLTKNGSCIVSFRIFNGYVDRNKKFPNLCILHVEEFIMVFRLGKEVLVIKYKTLLKQEMDHDEIYGDTWQDGENERLLHLKNDVLSTAFSYTRYAKGMEDLTGIGTKNCLILPSLAKKSFNSLRDENEEPIYTYKDEKVRWYVKQSIKGGRCADFNQYCKSIISDEVFTNV